ncbi:GDP-fucose protein O-fucosyltransferase 2 [Drosophila eugracilis]|uniref:GDP-fucose protein O-fucosyltransferase 2 n=1 Tax=Drosophila eugracilis TaxID=29029 RepID=UPI0007E81293|nr:GDP-fucose protein O-fucosyltransferase 2 [Drosophila eugracilis]
MPFLCLYRKNIPKVLEHFSDRHHSYAAQNEKMPGIWSRLGPLTLIFHFLLLMHGVEVSSQNEIACQSCSSRRSSGFCAVRTLEDILLIPETCPNEVLDLRGTVYILYDVNISEGFNLRRDVYIRLAVFVHHLQRSKRFRKVRLVLPPWPRLYHWHSQGLQQEALPWSHFFDLDSLRRYAPVLDYEEFLDEQRIFGNPGAPLVHVTHAFRLQHYDVMLEQGIFKDKFERIADKPCRSDSLTGGPLLRQPELRIDRFHCVQFQGSARLLEKLLRSAIDEDTAGLEDADDMRTYALLSAETVLHDHWGDIHFWRARRSMRFARRLSQVAADFRQKVLATVDAGVQRPAMWELERPKRNAIGGNYLCAHLRRGDFLRSREATTPSLKAAAQQVKQLLRTFNMTTVFLASDATPYELMELKELFKRFRFVHFTPESNAQRRELKDGGLAVVDQLICAYARYFVGTYESTFTYRIYEEREILGFSQASTFNTFCKVVGGRCPRNAVWPIMWGDSDIGSYNEEDNESDQY